MYVMTPEFGAASQLEKIDMLDFADVVAINKFERRGAEDALRDVGRQLVRNREAFGKQPEDMPVFGTSAATFNDDGVTALYQHLRGLLAEHGLPASAGRLPPVDVRHSTVDRSRSCRRTGSATCPRSPRPCATTTPRPSALAAAGGARAAARARRRRARGADEAAGRRRERCSTRGRATDAARRRPPSSSSGGRRSSSPTPATSRSWGPRQGDPHQADPRVAVRHKIRRVALPRFTDHGELLRFLRRENLPGFFPFTAGVFPFKRDDEDPARMFAGEGDPFRTNRRFKLLSEGQPATRLSTAFDSVTLYGRDPDLRPDIYGKVGTSGVSVATLDDMKALYDGFDLVAPTTSVSMTINGPAPTILAFFLNTVDRPAGRDVRRAEHGREPSTSERDRARGVRPGQRPRHRAGRHPQGGPGPEHLPVLHRVLAADDGRHPGVVHRARRCATSTRCRSPATTSPRPGRTRSASSRSRSPTGSPTSRPTSRAAWTSTTSRRTCRSSSPTAWTRSTPCSAASPAGSGRSRCARSTAPTSARRS